LHVRDVDDAAVLEHSDALGALNHAPHRDDTTIVTLVPAVLARPLVDGCAELRGVALRLRPATIVLILGHDLRDEAVARILAGGIDGVAVPHDRERMRDDEDRNILLEHVVTRVVELHTEVPDAADNLVLESFVERALGR